MTNKTTNGTKRTTTTTKRSCSSIYRPLSLSTIYNNIPSFFAYSFILPLLSPTTTTTTTTRTGESSPSSIFIYLHALPIYIFVFFFFYTNSSGSSHQPRQETYIYNWAGRAIYPSSSSYTDKHSSALDIFVSHHLLFLRLHTRKKEEEEEEASRALTTQTLSCFSFTPKTNKLRDI